MVAIYTLKIVTDFAASHILVGHPGPCSRLHGHNWKIEVEARAHTLNEIGMAIDFKDLKAATMEIVDRLDHRHMNDLEAFAGVNPTAENVAGYFFRELSRTLNDGTVVVSAVTVWETDRACVRYTEDR